MTTLLTTSFATAGDSVMTDAVARSSSGAAFEAGATTNLLFQVNNGLNFFMMLVQTIAALALVCGLAYVLFRWVLPRLQITGSMNRLVRVVDAVPVGPRRSIYVVEVAGQWLLVGSSEAGVQLLTELDPERAAEAANALERTRPKLNNLGGIARASFADYLARHLIKRK
ncbi:MAG: flagellar biosynthetic protein FliO [Pyrinomonadaceae bacterium]|nr:flagellar biosynthetic protein FliO [Pyrinomonadaceae bacterium]